VHAELLIDHAWGWEPCTIKEIKAYVPENTSLSSGQVLSCPYETDKARLVIHEMADALSLDLVEKKLLTNQIVLTIGYDTENTKKDFNGAVKADRYGRKVPKSAHGSINLEYTSSSKEIIAATLELYDSIINSKLSVRRMTIAVNHLIRECDFYRENSYEQLSLFEDYETCRLGEKLKQQRLQNERSIQEAVLKLKKRYGKNAVLKGMNFFEGATAISRNSQIGGHKA
jgi:DNA polymerase V